MVVRSLEIYGAGHTVSSIETWRLWVRKIKDLPRVM